MIKTIRNIFSIPDLRNRIMFTLGIVAVFRLGGHIPTPGINAQMLEQLFVLLFTLGFLAFWPWKRSRS